ncbi:MAG: sugar ABC transporter permease [Acutalibacteraceae bacterium]|nr:sugar ABC transporter permease [Acutalibacteraceae bacterium]
MLKNRKKNRAVITGKLTRRPIQKYFAIFLLPTVIAFVIGFVWPFIWGIYLSFYNFKTLSMKTFVGVENYIKAFEDSDFLYSFIFTAAYTVVTVILINVLAFMVAYVLTKGIKGSTVFRTVFFMPNLIGGIVLGYIWQLIINGIVSLINPTWILALNSTTGFIGLVVLMCWQQIGYMMIIYIAGLQSVPSSYIEAAKIDGASSWQILRRITIPCVMPSITICTFLTLTNSFKLFDQNLALTNGEPGGKTEMLALNIYKTFYESSVSKGVGQAKAVVFFVIVVVIALAQLYFTRRKEMQN